MAEIDDPRFVIGGYAKPPLTERIDDALGQAFAPAAAPEFEVQFDDISKWNGEVDFRKMRQFAQMVIIRAGYGDAGIDPLCEQNVAGAKAAGMEHTLYWFLMPRNNTNWTLALNSFGNAWEKYKGKVYPVFDAEYTELGKVETTKWLYNLKDGFIKKTGVKPIIYSRENWIEANTTQPLWLADLLNWLAQYNEYVSAPSIPLPWKSWWGWQYASFGMGPEHGGTGKSMDRNRCNMTIAQFNATFGTNIRRLGDPVQPPELPQYVYTREAINIRDKPGTIGISKALTRKGSTWRVIGSAYDTGGKLWYQIAEAAYIAAWYCEAV